MNELLPAESSVKLPESSEGLGLENDPPTSGTSPQEGAIESLTADDHDKAPPTDDNADVSAVQHAKLEPGIACIKAQYLNTEHKRRLDVKYLPKTVADELLQIAADQEAESSSHNPAVDEPPKKKQKIKGRNKNRPLEKKLENHEKICINFVWERECRFGEKCRFSHDVSKYVESKPADLGERCYIYDVNGKCPYGITCRFGRQHLTEDNKNIVNEELFAKSQLLQPVLNILPKEIQIKLWKRKYDFSKADFVVKQITQDKSLDDGTKELAKKSECEADKNSCLNQNEGTNSKERESKVNTAAASEERTEAGKNCDSEVHLTGAVTDEEVIRQRPQEQKKVDFRNKLYLAPLTTVGNLPFRRLCKKFGADITCSEMALATCLLQGQRSEWARVKRHHTEDIFGIQLCGAYPDSMTRCVQLLQETVTMDFIDMNCGCPIDLFFKKGEGCALMKKERKLGQIVRCVSSVLDLPFTIKLRRGIDENKSIAHNLVPKLRDWGASLVTIHGRSREQRYTRMADWDYIHQCAQAADPMPLFGNGDILSYEDYKRQRENTSVAGCMVARGALIKPWLFTEIKEERHWDISASERLDILKDFTNYGLQHWGSDQQGVSNTRKFLLEWLSFLHRYIPVGVLERLPQKINEKPPPYLGRNDLETLMASGNSGDWVKISEMLLGPVPDGFTFLPRHKAAAYK